MNNHLKQTLIFICLLWGFLPVAFADSVYVSDTLRVGVRSEPDNQVAPIGVVTTGMKLEVLERKNGYIQIRTPQGLTGWIKDIYVIKNAPAVIQLKQQKKQQLKLNEQIKTLQQANQVLEEANRVLNEKIRQLEDERARLQLQQAQLQAMQPSPISAGGNPEWIWWLAGFVLLTVAAFVGGVKWYRQQVMKRLGGLRV